MSAEPTASATATEERSSEKLGKSNGSDSSGSGTGGLKAMFSSLRRKLQGSFQGSRPTIPTGAKALTASNATGNPPVLLTMGELARIASEKAQKERQEAEQAAAVKRIPELNQQQQTEPLALQASKESTTLVPNSPTVPPHQLVAKEELEAYCMDFITNVLQLSTARYHEIMNASDGSHEFLVPLIAQKVTQQVRQELEKDARFAATAPESVLFADVKQLERMMVERLDACAKECLDQKSTLVMHARCIGGKYGTCSERGLRPANEDCLYACTFVFNLAGKTTEPYSLSMYAVYDGHGGPDCALFVSKQFHINLALHPHLHYGSIITKDILHETFLKTQEQWRRNMQRNGKSELMGCTAVVALLYNHHLFVAWAGDSSAILVTSDGMAANFVAPHKATIPTEAERIRNLGGFISNNRVNGSLAVTRAFGDFKFNCVNPEPEIKEYTLTGMEDYLLLACDGLTDVLNNYEISDMIRLLVRKHGIQNPDAISRGLVDEALRKGSTDNVSVVFVPLKERYKFIPTGNEVTRFEEPPPTEVLAAHTTLKKSMSTATNGTAIIPDFEDVAPLAEDPVSLPTIPDTLENAEVEGKELREPHEETLLEEHTQLPPSLSDLRLPALNAQTPRVSEKEPNVDRPAIFIPDALQSIMEPFKENALLSGTQANNRLSAVSPVNPDATTPMDEPAAAQENGAVEEVPVEEPKEVQRMEASGADVANAPLQEYAVQPSASSTTNEESAVPRLLPIPEATTQNPSETNPVSSMAPARTQSDAVMVAVVIRATPPTSMPRPASSILPTATATDISSTAEPPTTTTVLHEVPPPLVIPPMFASLMSASSGVTGSALGSPAATPFNTVSSPAIPILTGIGPPRFSTISSGGRPLVLPGFPVGGSSGTAGGGVSGGTAEMNALLALTRTLEAAKNPTMPGTVPAPISVLTGPLASTAGVATLSSSSLPKPQ